MQLEGVSKPIENYKGVMLCSRPGDNNTPQGPKPFCARVVPPDGLGLVPFKKTVEVKPTKKGQSIVSRHKKWLEEFGLRQIIRKEEVEEHREQEEEKFRRIREQAELDRQKAKAMKEEYGAISKSVMNVLDEDDRRQPPKASALNAENLRKLNELGMEDEPKPFKKKKQADKPAWALTEAQAQAKVENEQNQLLDFFETTDVDQFMNDTEVNAIMKALKQKIENIKKEQNWKEKQAVKAKNRQRQEAADQAQEDNRSVAQSKQSDGGKSVASEKSSKRIQQLKEKLEKKKQGVDEWDKNSKASKTSAPLEERIAKNVADEVLRSYGVFKGVHSNASIRRLLEQQAARQLVQPHPRPIITTLVRQKNALDMSNLPYLHRHPAV